MSSRCDGGWPPFPAEATKPKTVGEVIGHLPEGKPESHAPQVLTQWYQRNKYVGSFHSIRLDPAKPAPTMVKAHLHWHWSVPRHISIIEATLLASFPTSFKWAGGANDVKERIGNCVPPKFAQAIATCIREKVLGDREFTYISTFAGCGGSSLGYKWAGGKGLAAVEFDANAAETYRLNFPDTPVLERDIATVSAEELLKVASIGVGDLDILDGSPPCQGFSTAGKRELTDPRNTLFREYVRLIEGLQPKVFVMENVSGLVKGKMRLVFREIMLALKATGYAVRCKLLNAMYYEVPQSRERLIWIGVRPDVGGGGGSEFPGPVGKPKMLRAVCPDIVAQSSNSSHQTTWHDANRPANTIAKSGPGNDSGLCRDRDGAVRPFTIGELKRIATLPDSFKLCGPLAEQWARIGNSVPPRFMYHIASHIRDTVLSPTE